MKFINREKELEILDEYYKKEGFQFVPIYGRRRIGKTRLIQEFISNKPAVYFLADMVSETEQLKNLGRSFGEYLQDFILSERGFKDWYQFFQYLKEKDPKKLIVVIDEFPYLVNSNPAISSIFQKGIDEYLKNTNIFLVLMGSSVGMMEKEVLIYRAPLYGRRTASIKVPEMKFHSLKNFFPGKDFIDLTHIFSVFGTVPAYVEKYDSRKDIFQNIESLILDTGSFFYNEVEYLLREELREPRNYFVILKAISQGKRRVSEIINDTGFEKSLVSRYLEILKSLNIVIKDTPVTEKNPKKSKKGIYKLRDKFFTFWFKYIFPNRERIEIGRSDFVLGLIKNTFEDFVSWVYEEVCVNLCLDFLDKGILSFTSIGKWWSKDGEIDMVALDENTRTAYFGECKWSLKKVGEDTYRKLQKKSSLVDWHSKDRHDQFILFCKKGFTKNLEEIAQKENVLLVHKDRIIS